MSTTHDITDEDVLYLLKRGFHKRSDGQFDYIIGYHSSLGSPTYGVTFSIRDRIVYVSFNWGDHYIEEVLSILENLPSGKFVRVVKREPITDLNSPPIWIEHMTTATLSRFWDLGEEDIICPSQKSLYKIMNALILCNGKMHDSHSLEARDGKWEYSARSCAVCFRISLPIGMEEKFEELSGFKLSDPPKIHLN